VNHPAPVKRKRGGQPGNNNAFKHGYYSKTFQTAEKTDLETTDSVHLTDEINMLRVFMRRVIEQSESADNLTESLYTLRTLSLASSTVNRLIKTQSINALRESGDAYKKIFESMNELSDKQYTEDPFFDDFWDEVHAIEAKYARKREEYFRSISPWPPEGHDASYKLIR
jgi:hypothetical protein